MVATKEATFEESLERLEEIVEKLESGDLSLDESLKLYEEGVGMAQSCTKRLEQAQKKIETLMRTASGTLKTTEVDEDFKPKSKKKAK